MQKFFNTVTDAQGNAQQGVQIAIFQAGTSNLVVIYEDDEITPKTNPLASNDVGFFSAKVPNGKYDIKVGNNDPILGVSFSDANDVTITSGTIDGAVIGGTAPADATFDDLTVSGNFNN